MYGTIYIAHAYTSRTNCISMFAPHALRQGGLQFLTLNSFGSHFKKTVGEFKADLTAYR